MPSRRAFAAALSAQRALCCCDGICEAAVAAARLRAPLGSARLGWGWRRRPSALGRAALRASRSPCCGRCDCSGGCFDGAVLLLLLEGAALGPQSARPALTFPFPTPSLPHSSTPGVPSETPAPIQPVTAPSSSSRFWGRRWWAAGGSGEPTVICGRGGESQAAQLRRSPSSAYLPASWPRSSFPGSGTRGRGGGVGPQ